MHEHVGRVMAGRLLVPACGEPDLRYMTSTSYTVTKLLGYETIIKANHAITSRGRHCTRKS